MILLNLEYRKGDLWTSLIAEFIKCPCADVLKPAHIMKNALHPSSNVLALSE